MAQAVEVKVRLTDTDLFKDFIAVIKELLNDQMIDESVRTEYEDRINAIIEASTET